MKKIILLATLLSLFSCKKDKEAIPAVSVTGNWRGSLILGTTAVLVNRTDGTGNFYGLDGVADTASSSLKFHYKYTITGNVFHANGADTSGDTLIIQTSHTASDYMSGVILITNPTLNSGATYPFDVFKEP
jgi:hypothetical protein